MPPLTIPCHDPFLTLPAQFWEPATPAYFDVERHGWHLFSHADVLRAATDTAIFSQQFGDPDAHPAHAAMWAADDPRHSDLKMIVADPFKPRVLAHLAPVIREIADDLIDGIVAAGTGRFEAVRAFARPFPSRVICLIMGVDLAEDARFTGWVDEFDSAATITMTPAQPDMVRYLAALLDARRRSPQGGLVDQLIAAQNAGHCVAGERLSDRDMVGYLWGLLAAGFDTTAAGMINTLLFLTEYGHLGELRADRTLLAGAIEESLRWYPPFPGIMVSAKADVSIGGQHVRAGDLVTGWVSSANRDPGVFSEPGTFDIRREPNPHLSFARGAHYCLGASLARLELRIATDAILERLPGLRWDSAQPFLRHLGIVNRVEEAHFTFDQDRAVRHRPAAAPDGPR